LPFRQARLIVDKEIGAVWEEKRDKKLEPLYQINQSIE